MPPPVVSAPAPEPAATVADEDLEATGLMEPVASDDEPELDPRELKALSRQERKEAKAALRREQQEQRNAARQAKAMAKAAAKAGLADSTAAAAAATAAADDEAEVVIPEAPPVVTSEPVADETAVDEIQPIEADAVDSEDDGDDEPAAPTATDPRSRAAQRVQRRLGKDAEKLTAAEARARAREEARRRRAQAKEQRSGVVAEEAVRPPAGPAEGNLSEDVSVVELAEQYLTQAEPDLDEQVIEEPVIDVVPDETQVLDAVPDEPEVLEDAPLEEVADEAIDETPVATDEIDEIADVEEPEPDLPEPVFAERIDEPAPVEPEETQLEGAPRPWQRSESREISTPGQPKDRSSLAPIAGIVGLVALGISVLLAVGALLVALGFDSGGLYEALKAVANLLVGPLEGAFDFDGANAERKEHFLAWGAGSIGYLLISFVGQAVQRANDED